MNPKDFSIPVRDIGLKAGELVPPLGEATRTELLNVIVTVFAHRLDAHRAAPDPFLAVLDELVAESAEHGARVLAGGRAAHSAAAKFAHLQRRAAESHARRN